MFVFHVVGDRWPRGKSHSLQAPKRGFVFLQSTIINFGLEPQGVETLIVCILHSICLQ